jgi:flagellar hook protein FlgE
MWSGVSGLKTHQVSMDVIGNDIANVNTIAFKQSNVSFKDTLYKTVGGQQVGLGSGVGSITQDFNGGMLRETAVETNMALSGKGFFVMKDAAGTQVSYARAGDFQYSYNEASDTVSLANADGKYLYGTVGGTAGTAASRIELPTDMREMTISRDGVISYIDADGALVEDAYTIDIATFPNPTGLTQSGGNQLTESSESGSASFGDSDTTVVQGYLENSNVDLAKEFTEMIMAERGFQANSRTVTTSDSMLQELLNLKR